MNPPQIPTLKNSRRRGSNCVSLSAYAEINPIRNAPMILIPIVGTGISPIRYLATEPKKPPAPTTKQLNISLPPCLLLFRRHQHNCGSGFPWETSFPFFISLSFCAYESNPEYLSVPYCHPPHQGQEKQRLHRSIRYGFR